MDNKLIINGLMISKKAMVLTVALALSFVAMPVAIVFAEGEMAPGPVPTEQTMGEVPAVEVPADQQQWSPLNLLSKSQLTSTETLAAGPLDTPKIKPVENGPAVANVGGIFVDGNGHMTNIIRSDVPHYGDGGKADVNKPPAVVNVYGIYYDANGQMTNVIGSDVPHYGGKSGNPVPPEYEDTDGDGVLNAFDADPNNPFYWGPDDYADPNRK